MPDAEGTQEGQTATDTQTPAAATTTSSRSIDSFPDEAQDYIKRLRQENAGFRNELKGVKESLKTFEDRDKTEAQKALDRATELEGRVASSELKALRYEVAADKGVPLQLADRLRGSTKQELEADAEKLKQDFGLAGDGAATGGSGFDGGVRRPVTKRPTTMNGIIRQAAGR